MNWGGFDGWHPVGVIGTLVALAVSPVLGGIAAFLVLRFLMRLLRRATARVRAPVNAGQWVGSAALSFSHGANDAQKAVGVIAALLLATGIRTRSRRRSGRRWASAAALTLGTALGGWKIVKTVGQGIYRIRPARRALEPDELRQRDPRCVPARGARFDDACGRVVNRWHWHRPPPLAACPLG